MGKTRLCAGRRISELDFDAQLGRDYLLWRSDVQQPGLECDRIRRIERETVEGNVILARRLNSYGRVLEAAATHAANYLETLPHGPVAPKITPEELRVRLAKPLPQTGMAPEEVIEQLIK